MFLFRLYHATLVLYSGFDNLCTGSLGVGGAWPGQRVPGGAAGVCGV